MLRFGSAFVILRVRIPTFLYLDPDPYFSLFGSGSGVEETPKRHKSLIKNFFCNFTCVFGNYFIFTGSCFINFWKELKIKKNFTQFTGILIFFKPSGTARNRMTFLNADPYESGSETLIQCLYKPSQTLSKMSVIYWLIGSCLFWRKVLNKQ